MAKNFSVMIVLFCLLTVIPAGCSANMATEVATVSPSAVDTQTTPTITSLPAMTPYSGPLTVQYLGNACIMIMSPDGTRIISDPYSTVTRQPGTDPLPENLEANAVTVSHVHPDHNAVELVHGSPQVLDGPGVFEIGMLKVTGYGGFEGSPAGPSRMKHTIFVFDIDGARIVQLGDSGPVTDPEVLAGIEDADLILVNIDAYVFPLKEIMPFMQQIHARTVVPEHYSPLYPGLLDGFLAVLSPDVAVVRGGNEIQVTPEMPAQVLILTPLTSSP